MEASAVPWLVLSIVTLCALGGLYVLMVWSPNAGKSIDVAIEDAKKAGAELKLYCGVPASMLGELFIPLWFLLPCVSMGALLMFIMEEAAVHGIARVLMIVPSIILCACGICCGTFFACGQCNYREWHKHVVTNTAKANDETIKDLLTNGTIRLLSCAWLMSHPLAVIDRLQDLPDEAFLSVAAAVDSFGKGRVYVLSYGWTMAEHPDPEGFVLQRVIAFLCSSWASKFPTFAPSSFGLFWDFACLPQGQRSESEKVRFNAGLAVMSKLYGSLFNTIVIQVTSLPPEKAGYNRRPYHERGWCVAEEGAASTAAFYGARVSGMPPKLIDISGTEPQPHVPSCAPSVDEIERKIDGAFFTSGKDDKDKVLTQTKEFITVLSLGGKMIKSADVIGQPASDPCA